MLKYNKGLIMKKLLILITTLILFVGCNEEATTTSTTEMATNILKKEIFIEDADHKLATYSKYFEKIEHQKDLEHFFKEGESAPLVDFNTSYVLVYYTKYNSSDQIDDYKEEITLEDNESIRIEQIFIGETGRTYYSRALQIRLYIISNKIKNITMVHEEEITDVDINNLNPRDPRVSLLLVNDTAPYRDSMDTLLKVFNDNSSYQTFLSENNFTNLANKSIDFEHNRVLYINKYGALGDLQRFTERVFFPTSKNAKFIDETAYSHYHADEKRPAAIAYLTFIYSVDRSIDTIEYNGGDVIDMRIHP